MASHNVVPDIESQATSVPESQPPPLPELPPPAPNLPPAANLNDPQESAPAVAQPQAANPSQNPNGNAPAQQNSGNSQVQRDENHGDSSDGLWSIYLTEAEKQDGEITENWKGDTDGILVFTGLFSATVASFIIESYQNLSPDSSDTANALLTQISQQLVNISLGAPLTIVTAQSNQPFKPTASAVRVNVLWFLSLILSLNCALSATLMQQWARRYKELAQRRGAFHRRGRMRAYIFDGINKFGMARAVATMPTLLHISVFLFFAGLVDFLFPIYATVAYSTLGCIGVFALAYAILTVLPTLSLNCPYGTPLSGLTWRISQFSVFIFLWTILQIQVLLVYRKSLSKLRSWASKHAFETHGPKKWWEVLDQHVKTHRQRFSQSLRKSVELSAFSAGSVVVTNALKWTLTALDEDKEIEDFAARVPGFFDSRAVPDATSAVLSLMSHHPNTDPIFGSRLYDLLKTCTPGSSTLDETTRKHRLRVCLKCLWHFGRVYNQPGVSQPLPTYFPKSLIPEIIRLVQTEKDTALRVMGRCVIAVILNKPVEDHKSGTIPLSDEVLSCVSAALGTGSHDLKFLRHQPGAVALANRIPLAFGEVGTLVPGLPDVVPLDLLDVVQQTLEISSQTPAHESDEIEKDMNWSEADRSYGKFEHILISHLLEFLNLCTRASPLVEDVRTSCLRMSLKRLWFFGRKFNQRGNSSSLPTDIRISFSNPEMIRRILEKEDLAVRAIGRCVGALVVNKLVADINLRTAPVGHAGDSEVQCLSAILGTEGRGVGLLLRKPGAATLANIVSLVLDGADTLVTSTVPSDVLDVVRQTLVILSQALPAQGDAELQLKQTIATFNGSDGNLERILVSRLLDLLNTCIQATSTSTEEVHAHSLRMCLKRLWSFDRTSNQPGNSVAMLSYICVTFAGPEISPRIREQRDRAILVGRCVGALAVNKLAADLNSRTDPIKVVEVECISGLSAILGTKNEGVMLLLRHQGAIELTNLVFFALANIDDNTSASVRWDILYVVQQTFDILSRALLVESNIEMRLNQTDNLTNGHGGFSSLNPEISKTFLHTCLKNLWSIVRASAERGNSAPLPPSICVSFASPEMIRRIREHRGFTARNIGRCVGALVVNKLVASLNSCADSIKDVELECISAILGTKHDKVMRLLSHPGAIELTNTVFLAFANIDDFSSGFSSARVLSDSLDVVQKTFDILSQALPAESTIKERLDQTETLMDVSGGMSCLTPDVYKTFLHQNLWNAVREFNEHGNSVPLPPYICAAFANPEMTHRIREQCDLSARNTGRCVGALVVNKLAADPNSRTNSIIDLELECISEILGIQHDEVVHLLRHRGAIELTNMIFLTLANIDDFASARVPSEVLNTVQQTFDVLSRALPAESNVKTRLNWTDTLMDVSVGISSLAPDMFFHMCLKNMWNAVRAFNGPGNSVPLPSFISVAFADGKMSRRIREQRDSSAYSIGHCVGALVVRKLVTDLSSHNDSIRDVELKCISAILGTESHSVMLWLRHPGAIELAGMLSLALEAVFSLVTDVVPSHVLDVVLQTLDFISEALPVEGIAQQPLDQTISLINATDSNFELIVSSNLQKFLKACIPNTSPLGENVRTSSLRLCLKSLWCFSRLYHRADASIPLPSYFSLIYASPEITHLIRTESDPYLRVIGRCFEALVIDKLVEDTDSLTDEDVAFLSVILGKESHILRFWLNQPGAIDLRNVIFVISDEIDTFVTDAIPADVLEVFQQTLGIIGRNLARGRGSTDDELYMGQVLYFHSIYSMIADSGGADWLRYRLEWMLSQLPAVENWNSRRRSDLVDEELSECGVDDSSFKSISESSGE